MIKETSNNAYLNVNTNLLDYIHRLVYISLPQTLQDYVLKLLRVIAAEITPRT